MAHIAVSSDLINNHPLFNHVAEDLPYRSARAIKDSEVMSRIGAISASTSLGASLSSPDIRIQFLEAFPKWLGQTQLNKLRNLGAFPYVTYTHGTIQAFDAFYAAQRSRRFRCFKGEFMYHRVIWRQGGYAFQYLEDAPVASGDAVVISLPFSDTGSTHHLMQELTSSCSRLHVPILVDCAYVNIGSTIDFDFDQPAIDTIAFSLSKAFHGMDKLRIGVRLKRKFEDDAIDVFNTAGMVNHYGCAVGHALIERFGPDYNFKTYRTRQLQVCKEMQIAPSNCVIFGLGGQEWSAYNRGGAVNRLCINGLIEAARVPHE